MEKGGFPEWVSNCGRGSFRKLF